MPHWNLDKSAPSLSHLNLYAWWRFGILLCRCTYIDIFHVYATHIVYWQIHGLCWFMYIWSYVYNWHFWKMLFLHCLCLFFSSRQKFLVGGKWSDLFLLVWRQKWDFDCLKFWGESQGAAVASLFLFLPQLSIISLLACILDVNVTLTLHLVFTTGCLV